MGKALKKAAATPGPCAPGASSIGAFHAANLRLDLAGHVGQLATQAAGVNRTSIDSHFSSPEDLAIHALGELFDVVGNADIAMRGEHSVPAAEASRRALRDIVSFVAQRRESYARVLGRGAAPRLLREVTEAFAGIGRWCSTGAHGYPPGGSGSLR